MARRSVIAGAVIGLLPALALCAAVEGTVINRTTGKPQPGAVVTLLSMSGGSMAVHGRTTSDQSGKFRIDQTIRGQELLQAVHQGVTYSRLLRPETPSSPITLEVYEVSGDLGAAKVLRHAVLLQPSGMDLSVRENIVLRNDRKVTLRRPKEGTFRFYVPDSATATLRVSSRSPTGMPLQQTPVKTGEPGVHQVDFPIRPGDNQLDLSYTLPFRSPGTFVGKTLQRDVPVRLVVPSGVTLTGGGLRFLGQEQKSGASNYVVETPEYKVMIQAPISPPDGNRGPQDTGSEPQQILPRVYDNVYWILGLALGTLMLGFARLYRMAGVPVARTRKPEAARAIFGLPSRSLANRGHSGRQPVGVA